MSKQFSVMVVNGEGQRFEVGDVIRAPRTHFVVVAVDPEVREPWVAGRVWVSRLPWYRWIGRSAWFRLTAIVRRWR